MTNGKPYIKKLADVVDMKAENEDVSRTSPNARQNQVERCTSYLLQKIESGEIGMGTRLGEPSLAREIGTDRATVRATFERLSATGILERVPRSGTYLKTMLPEEMRSANQVRCQLEMLGARLAATEATKDECQQLIKTAGLLDELTDDFAQGKIEVWSSIRSLEIEYHTMIARASHNSHLLAMLNRDSFLQVCFPFLMISTSLKQESLREYLQDSVTNLDVAMAIRNGDPEAAAEVIARHVLGSLILYERGLSEQKQGEASHQAGRVRAASKS